MDYSSMTLAELREIARSKGMKSITGLKKAELMSALMAGESADKEPKKKKTIKTDNKPEKKDVRSNKKDSSEISSDSAKADLTKADSLKEEKLSPKRKSEKQQYERKNVTNRASGSVVSSEGKGYEPSKTEKKPFKQTKPIRNNDYRMQKGGYQEKNNKQDTYPTEGIRYDSRPPKNEAHTEGRPDAGIIRSVTLEVQEAPGYEAEREKERTEDKKPINIRNEAFTKDEFMELTNPDVQAMDSKTSVNGILEIMEGYGFIRSANYLPGENDIYVSPAQIRRFNLKTGDILKGNSRVKNQNEKFGALLYVESVNGFHPLEASKRRPFEELTPIFPEEKIRLEQVGAGIPMRIIDIIAPIGKGQRGMIVSPPKAGKTTLLKQIAKTISRNYEDMHLLVLLIDERPEEVTDIRESIEGPNVEVIYSTFDELPDHHKRVAEMVLERARRLVEHKKDVVILLDSITRLARAYNLIVPPSGRTLTGGLDPAALHMPKKFFGAARNIREGGSLTILATALVDTGSKMDDVVFEEFKGTGNMELVLDRKLSEKRIFPAIDIAKSSTRRDDLLLTKEEQDAMYLIHRESSGSKGDETIEEVLKLFARTKNNSEFVQYVQKSLGRRP
ncbi:MAG: transcription termination factor Rho [Lachnospiraceae bacterium]|nr:transcription termination factor Rho [Lachnospiraceae bacterium]